MATLVLAWSSAEYIGQGAALRFPAQDTIGKNRTSMVDENVTAILTSNTNISGVPVLVSELRIIADRDSTVTCESVTTNSTMSKEFNISGMYVHCIP